jgi:hypothetical protein
MERPPPTTPLVTLPELPWFAVVVEAEGELEVLDDDAGPELDDGDDIVPTLDGDDAVPELDEDDTVPELDDDSEDTDSSYV